jgi:hypothetical protein
MVSFLLGAIAGAAATMRWHPQLNRMRTDGMPGFRNQLADKIEVFERSLRQRISAVSGRACETLRGGRAAGKPEPTSAHRM